jgi:putative hydrolase of the HAD superfamily
VAVIFDLGGVLLRWQPVELLQQVLPGCAPDAAVATALAARLFQSFEPGSDWAEFDRGALGVPALVQRLSMRLSIPADAVQRLVDAVPAHLVLLPDTVTLLRRLQAAGERLLYLSNMPAPFIGPVRARLQAIDLFEDGVFSADVGLVKPEPAIFGLASQRFGLAPEACRFLDDNAVNVAAARSLGWPAWQFHDAAQAGAALGLAPIA